LNGVALDFLFSGCDTGRVTAARTDVVEFDGARLEFDVAGEGPAVALLHPGLWDRRTWDDQFRVFSQSYRVLRHDARGYGRSSRPEHGRPYSHVEDFMAVMDAAGVDRGALIGCSMGGRIALDASLAHPDRVSALVLIAPGVSGVEEGTPEEEAWYAEHYAPIQDAIGSGELERAQDLALDTFWATLGTADLAGARIREIAFANLHTLTMDESGEGELEPPAIDRLEAVAATTLILPADHDPPWTSRICQLLAERIPDARLVQIPDVDHVVNMRKPTEFNDVALTFLSEVLGEVLG
jgi:pimeloyl-ACP methyl ester carboxylesterase